MRIGGKEISGAAEEVLVLPRLDGNIIIRARAVLDMDEFDALCPKPKAGAILKAGGGFHEDVEDAGYKAMLADYNTKRFDFICLKSLEPSNIDWDTVNRNDANTWKNWGDDLTNAGISSVEANRIIKCVLQANSLDEDKIKEARELFLRGQEVLKAELSGQDTEPQSTPSGEPASVGA